MFFDKIPGGIWRYEFPGEGQTWENWKGLGFFHT